MRRSWLIEAGPLGWIGFGIYTVALLLAVWVIYKYRTLPFWIPAALFCLGNVIGMVLIGRALGWSSGRQLGLAIGLNVLVVAVTLFRLYVMRKQQQQR